MAWLHGQEPEGKRLEDKEFWDRGLLVGMGMKCEDLSITVNIHQRASNTRRGIKQTRIQID